MSGGIEEAIGGTVFGEGRDTRSGSAQWRRGRDEARETWDEAQDRGSRALSQVENSAEDAYYATRRFVYHHPFQAILGVTAFAFAVGALWRLGSNSRRSFGHDMFGRFSDYVEPQVRAMRRKW